MLDSVALFQRSHRKYIRCFTYLQGFLTDSGDVNLDRVQVIMSDLGDAEDEIFKKRQQNELAFKQREKDKKRRNEIISNFKPKWIPTGQFAPTVREISVFFLLLLCLRNCQRNRASVIVESVLFL